MHVQGADEDEGEEARSEQEPDGVGTSDGTQSEERKRQQGCLDPGLDDEKGDEQSCRRGEQGHGLGGAPAHLRRLRNGVDEDHQRTGDGHCSEGVVPTPLGAQPALGHHLGRQGQGSSTDGHVEKEDVLPPDIAGEQATSEHSDGGAHGTHSAPDAQGLVALGALGEHVHHDREGGR